MPLLNFLSRPARRDLQRAIDRAWYDAGHAAGCLVKAAADDPVPVYALRGRLVLSKSGWGLVEVPNSLVRGAFRALHEPGVELPPSKEGRLRAHISVLRPEDIEALGGPQNVTEWGKAFSYQLGPVKTAKPLGWDDVARVWFISVTSPDLQTFRKSYGLSPLPTKNGKELAFHVTVAVRRRNVLRNNEVSKAAAESPLTSMDSSHTAEHDGTVYDVLKLIERTEGRPVEHLPLDTLQNVNGFSRSRRDGFSRKRYAAADVSHPVLLDESNTLWDGRHRLARLFDAQAEHVPVRRVTEEDLAAVKVASSGYFCETCKATFNARPAADKCPHCSGDPVPDTTHHRWKYDPAWRKKHKGEYCPHCGAMHERGDDGKCNSCGEVWVEKAAESPLTSMDFETEKEAAGPLDFLKMYGQWKVAPTGTGRPAGTTTAPAATPAPAAPPPPAPAGGPMSWLATVPRPTVPPLPVPVPFPAPHVVDAAQAVRNGVGAVTGLLSGPKAPPAPPAAAAAPTKPGPAPAASATPMAKAALGPVLQKLKDAKAESDRGNFPGKHAIMKALLEAHPDEFFEDSRQGRFKGVTHRKTGFKIHVPAGLGPELSKTALRLAPGALASILVPTAPPERKSHDRMTVGTPAPAPVPLAPPEEGDAGQILRALSTARRVRRRSRLVRIPTVLQ